MTTTNYWTRDRAVDDQRLLEVSSMQLANGNYRGELHTVEEQLQTPGLEMLHQPARLGARHCSLKSRSLTPPSFQVSPTSSHMTPTYPACIPPHPGAAPRPTQSRLMVSWMTRPMSSTVISRIPLVINPCSSFCGSFFPPCSASTHSSSRYPPSSAGSGSTFRGLRQMPQSIVVRSTTSFCLLCSLN